MENHTTVMKMGILEIVSSSSCIPRALSSVLNVNIVLEEELVLEYLGDYVNAFIVLFWIIVCTHPREQQELKGIVYPKMKNSVILTLMSFQTRKAFVHLQKTN